MSRAKQARPDLEVIREWRHCLRCNLHRFRRHVVIGEGVVPADVLFIGEGPGKTENLRGRPFVGVAGQALREVLGDAMLEAGEITYYLSNVVACRPCDAINGDNRKPTEEEAWSCFARLEQIYSIVKPRRVVFLGRVPQRFCRKGFREGIYIEHPSSFNRKGGVSGPHYLGYKQVFVELIESLEGG